MQTQPPLPHLLLPYISSPPPSSLTLISSVLGATSNWLVLRYLYAVLQHGGRSRPSEHSTLPSASPAPKTGTHRVVLVSFLRNSDFWRAEAKRLVRIFLSLSFERKEWSVDVLIRDWTWPVWRNRDCSCLWTG